MMIVWNLLRALSFIESVSVIALTIQVWRFYYSRFRLAHATGASDRRKRRRAGPLSILGPPRAPWIGLLPGHVWKLGFGVSGMSGTLIVFAIDRVGHAPLWGGLPLVLAVIAQLVVLAGLYDVLRYEHRLIQRH